MTKPKGEWAKTPIATESPSIIDIAWAAGIYEGEGSVAKGRLSVHQADEWLVKRFQKLFGGTISYTKSRNASDRGCFAWQVSGARARGVMFTLFSFLSPRRRMQLREQFLYTGAV